MFRIFGGYRCLMPADATIFKQALSHEENLKLAYWLTVYAIRDYLNGEERFRNILSCRD